MNANVTLALLFLVFLLRPDDLPGLAHFCEHLLFLGTDKYPDENRQDRQSAGRGRGRGANVKEDMSCHVPCFSKVVLLFRNEKGWNIPQACGTCMCH